MTTTLIFDIGGVLTQGKHTSGIAKLISKKYGVEDTFLKIDPLMKFIDGDEIPFNEFLDKLNLIFNTNITSEELIEIFDKAFIPNTPIINKIQGLRKRYRLLIISDISYPVIDIFKSKLYEIIPYFDKMYFSCELKVRKPHKEIFEHVIKDAKLKPEECIFIDDKEKNIKSAENLGIHGILFKKNSDINSL